MEITWFGHSCFRLSERGKAVIVTDPFSDSIGLPMPKLKADVVTISHDAPGHSNAAAVKNYRRIVNEPGEYEIGGVFIMGVPMHNTLIDPPRWNVAYVFEFDGLTIAHLGDLDHLPPQSVLEELGNVNVLLVPVGAGHGLNATQAVELISMLEPSYIIPMHYLTPDSRLSLEPLDRFLKEMGVSRVQQEEIFKVGSGSLPEQTQIVVLEASR